MLMQRKQQRTLHKITKQLEREVRHRAWLEQNLKNSQQVKDSRKRVLVLYTEAAELKLRETKI
jgi:predicted lipoprotein